MIMEQDQLKQTLRDKLSALSKEELVEIIANITSVYVAMSALSRANIFSNMPQAVYKTEFDFGGT